MTGGCYGRTIVTVSSPQPDRALGLGPTRARVLATVQDSAGPATASAVGERLGLHVNTARFHLEGLADADLVVREREDRAVPGRPRVHYRPVTGVPAAGHRSYRLLAEILTAHLATTAADPERSAAAAGETFGRLAARERRPAETAPSASAEEATRIVVEALGEMGFGSRAVTEPSGIRLDVGQCPFLEVATEHQGGGHGGQDVRPAGGPGGGQRGAAHLGVVCAVHRGLMQGLLDGLEAPLRVDALDPLVGPSHCVARLVRRPPTAPTRAGAAAR